MKKTFVIALFLSIALAAFGAVRYYDIGGTGVVTRLLGTIAIHGEFQRPDSVRYKLKIDSLLNVITTTQARKHSMGGDSVILAADTFGSRNNKPVRVIVNGKSNASFSDAGGSGTIAAFGNSTGHFLRHTGGTGTLEGKYLTEPGIRYKFGAGGLTGVTNNGIMALGDGVNAIEVNGFGFGLRDTSAGGAIYTGDGSSTVQRALFDATGHFVLSTTLKTAQPSVTGAGEMKFGKIVTGSDTFPYWQLSVDGTVYYIRAFTTLP